MQSERYPSSGQRGERTCGSQLQFCDRGTLGLTSGIRHTKTLLRRSLLDQKKDLVTKERFLSSFVLPDKQIEPPTVAAEATEKPTPAETPAATAEGQKREAPAPGSEGATDVPDAKPGQARANESAAPPDQARRPISGGVLNGKAISLPQPVYPAEARAARVSGSVTVSGHYRRIRWRPRGSCRGRSSFITAGGRECSSASALRANFPNGRSG